MDGQSHTTAPCPTCQEGRTFQLGQCVVCGHALDEVQQLADTLQAHNPLFDKHTALLAAGHAQPILDQPRLVLLPGGAR